MSANDREGTLPAPHDVIKVSVSEFTENRFHVEYIGTPTQLVAAGIVNDHMQGKILNQRSGAMLNGDGYSFSVRGKTGATKRATWERTEEVCRIAYYSVGRHRLMRLPGIAAFYPDGLEECDSTTDLSAAIHALGRTVRTIKKLVQQGAPMRHRLVGRFRRPTSWYTVGSVLYVDWSDLAKERVLARV